LFYLTASALSAEDYSTKVLSIDDDEVSSRFFLLINANYSNEVGARHMPHVAYSYADFGSLKITKVSLSSVFFDWILAER
jgi:hypothetical protein